MFNMRAASLKSEACNEIKRQSSWVWWCMPVIPALGQPRKDLELEASLGYTVRSCLKKNKIN
jgi:hypothetical protein